MKQRRFALTLCSVVLVLGAVTSCGDDPTALSQYGALNSAAESYNVARAQNNRIQATCRKLSDRRRLDCWANFFDFVSKSNRSIAVKLADVSTGLTAPCGPTVKRWSEALQAEGLLREKMARLTRSLPPTTIGKSQGVRVYGLSLRSAALYEKANAQRKAVPKACTSYFLERGALRPD